MPSINLGAGRVKRLKQDLIDMKALSEKCPAINFKTLDDGDAPEKYEVYFYLKTIIGEENGKPIYREANNPTIVLIELSEYPLNRFKTQCITMPQPYHPNWYDSGRWGDTTRLICSNLIEPLAIQVIQIAKEIQFSFLTNLSCYSNAKAADWCQKNKAEYGYFPCDDTIIPDYKDIRKPITIIRKRKDDVNA